MARGRRAGVAHTGRGLSSRQKRAARCCARAGWPAWKAGGMTCLVLTNGGSSSVCSCRSTPRAQPQSLSAADARAVKAAAHVGTPSRNKKKNCNDRAGGQAPPAAFPGPVERSASGGKDGPDGTGASGQPIRAGDASGRIGAQAGPAAPRMRWRGLTATGTGPAGIARAHSVLPCRPGGVTPRIQARRPMAGGCIRPGSPPPRREHLVISSDGSRFNLPGVCGWRAGLGQSVPALCAIFPSKVFEVALAAQLVGRPREGLARAPRSERSA